MKLKLVGKNRKAKNKLQRDGDVFVVLFEAIPIFDKDKCLHFCLENANEKNHLRWVKIENDEDFDYTIVEK
jgi:hypothetical protein